MLNQFMQLTANNNINVINALTYLLKIIRVHQVFTEAILNVLDF